MTPEDLLSRLLYRDALMLVIDKPAGIPVHKGTGGGETLDQHFDALRFGLPRAPALAHRLDRDTSGCLVLGGSISDGKYHDTHTDPVPEAVLELLAQFTAAGHHPAIMLERDGNYPPALELLDELDAIADAAGLDRITAGTDWSRT